MNRTIKVALLAVLGTALFVPAIAQDNFPDVPENHWAYEALENLKREGILVGYPDGTYKGPRDLTRYELAVALNAAYQRMKMMHDGLADQIAEIKRSLSGMGGGGTDVKPIMDRLTAVENQLKGMSRLQSDVDAMKRMADEFQKELASMGVDVEAMKKDIADLQAKMGQGGGSGLPISISGDVNIIMHAGEGDGENSSMGIDGRQLGLNDAGTQAVSWSRDINTYHELALNIAGGGDGAPKWWGTLVFGNLIGVAGTTATSGYGNQGNRFGGQPFRTDAGDMYVQSLGVELENGVAGMPFKATVGRVGFQTKNPYLFRRIDNTPYWKNDRWDNGNWMMDGFIVSFGFGESNLNLICGSSANRRSVNGVELQPMLGTGASAVDGTFGATADFKLGAIGDINLAYLMHTDANNSFGNAADRLEVYGGSANLNLVKGLPIGVGYGKSNLKDKGTNINDNDNESMWAKANWEGDKWGFGGGYRRVESNYMAAGSWKRIGTNWSPANIETFNGMAWFGMGENAKLWAGGEFGETIDTLGGIPAESKITSANIGLEWGFNEWWKAMLGYEDVKVDFAGSATEIRQKWFTVGFGWMMGKNSSLNFTYQWGDVQNGAAWGAGPAGNYKGHIVATSLGIKF